MDKNQLDKYTDKYGYLGSLVETMIYGQILERLDRIERKLSELMSSSGFNSDDMERLE